MEPFQTVGVVCLVAAIIGGGLKAAGFEIGAVKSLGRQTVLGVLGLSLFAYGTPEVRNLAAPAPVAPMVLVAVTPTAVPIQAPTVAPTTLPTPPPTSPPTASVPPTQPPAEPTPAPPTQVTAEPTAAAPPTAAPVVAPASAPAAAPAPAARPTLGTNRPEGPLRR